MRSGIARGLVSGAALRRSARMLQSFAMPALSSEASNPATSSAADPTMSPAAGCLAVAGDSCIDPDLAAAACLTAAANCELAALFASLRPRASELLVNRFRAWSLHAHRHWMAGMPGFDGLASVLDSERMLLVPSSRPTSTLSGASAHGGLQGTPVACSQTAPADRSASMHHRGSGVLLMRTCRAELRLGTAASALPADPADGFTRRGGLTRDPLAAALLLREDVGSGTGLRGLVDRASAVALPEQLQRATQAATGRAAPL